MLKKLYSNFKESLQSERHDFTQIDISRAVVLLAIPMILELALESVFAIVDMFFVSRLGANAIATVGLTESVITVVYSISIGLSTGATAIIARRVGEKHLSDAAHAGAQSILVALAISIVIAILGVALAGRILEFMGAAPDVVRVGTTFARILIGGNTAILLLFLLNGIFRGAGDAAMAMKSLWVASGLNIILCPLCIHFFGLKGAAIATVVGRSCGVAYQCKHLFNGSGVLKFAKRHFHVDFGVIRSLLQISWPAALQFLIGSGSWIILTRLVAQVGGTDAVAAYQIAFRNLVFFILPAWGLSNAAATLVGQNLGAKEPHRAEVSVYKTAKYSAMLMFFVTILFLFGAPLMARIFTRDPSVFSEAVIALRVVGSGFLAYGIGMVLTQALNGSGDTSTPTWINFFCFWIFQIPFAYYLAKETSLGVTGIMIAIPLSQLFMTLASWFVFRGGRWKNIKV